MEKQGNFEASGLEAGAFGVGLEKEPKEGAAALPDVTEPDNEKGSVFSPEGDHPDINPNTPEKIRPWLFQKGRSGNPKGRPRRADGGKVDRRTLYKELFDQGGADVIAAMIQAAKNGDTKAGAVILKYLLPEARSELNTIDLGLPDNAPLEQRLAALSVAVTDGSIAPDAAAQVAKSLRDATESAKLLEAMSRMDSLKKEIGRLNGVS